MKNFISIVSILFGLLIFVCPADAVYDLQGRTNNIFGIHILYTYELPKAAELVNSSGGDWGYVTIPMQAGDRDLEKWQKFMDETKAYHIIPRSEEHTSELQSQR